MCKYFISCFMLLYLVNGYTQADTLELDSVPTKDRYGLRLGIDISKPIRAVFEEDYTGFEVVGDLRISHKWYAAAEIGNEERTSREDLYNFTTKGSYIRLGLDYNAYENWLDMENMIHLGFRLSAATFEQTLNEYRLFNSNQFFNESATNGTTQLGTFDGLNATWVEFVAGIKAEIFNNFYMGISIRLYYLFSDTAAPNLNNLWIPGFNKVTDDSKFGVGFNYTLSYFIPLFKKTRKKKEKALGKGDDN